MSLLLTLLALTAPINTAFAQDDAPEEEEAPPPVVATTYALNPSAGMLVVRTYKEGVAAALAHDHAVQATGWSGTVTWHPEDASKCKVEITVPVSGLVVDQSAARGAMGLTGAVDADQQKEITANMVAEGQLNGAKFPNITFSSTSCSGTSGQVTVKGNMSIRGASAPISATLNVTADGKTFAAQGSFGTSHSAFGISPYSAMFGAIANGDRLDFAVNIQGSAR